MPRNRTAPPVCADDIAVEERNQEVHITIGTRRYRVRGLERNQSGQQLRVNILATRDDLVHMDTLDLCQARSRASFVRATATELFIEEAIVKRDVGRILLALEQLQQQRIEAATAAGEANVELTETERDEALGLLRDPSLIDRILADYETCGLVGEETNKLICYLSCVSRHLNQPLAVLIQSGSAAGKTSMMDATLHFMPPETQVRYSAMTGQSLYYMGRHDLRHRILAVAEEEGVAQASYALKLLQSDGKLRIAAAGKNSGTGRQETESYEIEGPVMMFLTTTSQQPDAELQNRCLTLHVDESPEQTEAIHARQRAAYTLDGQLAEDRRQQIGSVHQNAQRLLESLPVTIPWAEQLKFRNDQTRMRRDHAKYLALIAAITLLHQHQRPLKTHAATTRPSGKSRNQREQATSARAVARTGQRPCRYLEATPEDAALANRLMSQVMGQSLDALLPQTRQLVTLIDDYVRRRAKKEKKPRGAIRFTQRELREQLGWGDFQVRRHLARLVELEYVLAHRTGHGNQREYELLYEGQGRQGERFLLGLANIEKLSTTPLEV